MNSFYKITGEEYVAILVGEPVGRDRKVACPFHTDRTPSVHAYSDHWLCFSCRAGGTIYDLAARLWLTGQKSSEGGREQRGRDFVEVRRRLLELFVDRRYAG